MMQLSKQNLQALSPQAVKKPLQNFDELPEKIIQFGTGVLLRGLCDYVVDDANRKGLFGGRVVVIKSTDAGDTKDFERQNNLYTICIRGVDGEKIVEENIICTAISRVLSAKNEWEEILRSSIDPQIQVIISNTTEVGLQLVKENVSGTVPASFPGKLLALLLNRYKNLGDTEESRLIVIPTELLSNNGSILRSIVLELAAFNKVEDGFMRWLDKNVTFCNSLVDRIVTKDPGGELLDSIQQQLGYEDQLLTMCEDYALWAIEGSDEVQKVLTFANAENGAFVTDNIDIFKFLKLHLLNGTHTLSASLAYLAGFEFVKDGMSDPVFASYVKHLQQDIAKAIPYDIAEDEIQSFSAKVLDRFRNPFLQHKWINITLQNTMKMKNRNVPVLLRYHELYNRTPQYMATGFAAFLLFMKAVKKDGNNFYGERNGELYMINDEQASYFYDIWKANNLERVVDQVLANESMWGSSLVTLNGFADAVKEKLTSMLSKGVRNTISEL